VRAVLVRGVAGSVLIAAGGWCYARVPKQTWVDRIAPLWSVRSSAHHLTYGLALSGVGLVLSTWAWWELVRRVRGVHAGLPHVRRAAALWGAPLLLAPPLFSADGWSYVATGDLAGRGLSPYAWTPAALPEPLRSGVSPVWRFTPSPYGPLSLAWGGAFSRVTHEPWVLLTAYRVAAALGLLLLSWTVPVLARRGGRDPVTAAALVLPSPFVLAHGIGGLHNDLVVAALVVAALAVSRPGRWLPGALLVGVAAAVKAPGALAAVGVVLLSLAAGAHWTARVRRAVEVGAVVVGAVLAAGWSTGLGTGWIPALAVPDHEQTVLSVPAVTGRWLRLLLRHAGPAGLRVAHDVHPEILAKRIGLLLLVLLAAVALLRGRLDPPGRAVAGGGAVLLGGVLLSPVVHYWYFLWCLPVLVCAPVGRAARAAVTAGIATLGLIAPADRALHLSWLYDGSAWALLLVPAGVAAYVALGSRRSETDGTGVARAGPV
jgi:alpha-1,6-mannosyltransferase